MCYPIMPYMNCGMPLWGMPMMCPPPSCYTPALLGSAFATGYIVPYMNLNSAMGYNLGATLSMKLMDLIC